jgi:hypothetical protein
MPFKSQAQRRKFAELLDAKIAAPKPSRQASCPRGFDAHATQWLTLAEPSYPKSARTDSEA